MRTSNTELERGVDRFLGRAFNELGSLYGTAEPTTAPLDLMEAEDRFILRLDVPGVPRDAIELTVEDGRLLVSGGREIERQDGVRYHRVERRGLRFRRSFRLPDSVDPSAVAASLNDGVLQVTLTKVPEKAPQVINIAVG
jgi:HSP20 family protein